MITQPVVITKMRRTTMNLPRPIIQRRVLHSMPNWSKASSLAQRDELKKVGAIRPYPLEWDSVPYPLKFKPPTLHSYDGKSLPNQYIYYLRSQTSNVVGNNAIMARLFIGTLKGGSLWLVQKTSRVPGLTWKPDFSPNSTRMIPRWSWTHSFWQSRKEENLYEII